MPRLLLYADPPDNRDRLDVGRGDHGFVVRLDVVLGVVHQRLVDGDVADHKRLVGTTGPSRNARVGGDSQAGDVVVAVGGDFAAGGECVLAPAHDDRVAARPERDQVELVDLVPLDAELLRLVLAAVALGLTLVALAAATTEAPFGHDSASLLLDMNVRASRLNEKHYSMNSISCQCLCATIRQ